MKSTKPFLLSLIGLFLFSCNQGTELTKGSYDNYVLQRLQNCVETEYYRGKERISIIKEIAFDKSERERANRGVLLLNSVLCIDTACHNFIRIVNEMKREMIKDKSELKRLRKQENSKRYNPFTFDFGNIKIFEPSNVEQKIEKIQTEIIKLRTIISETIVAYDSGDSSRGKYSFVDPVLGDFDSYPKLINTIEAYIQKSNVAQDDKEALKKIYAEMTKLIYSIPTSVSNGVEFFTFLSAAEHGVFAARADAFSLMRSRIGCFANYSFNKIIPIINAPPVAFQGDIVEVYGLMAAFDSDAHPYVHVNGVNFSDVRNGIAYHKFIIKDKSNFKLKGTVTYLNKSGVPKTMPFEKTIKVLPKGE